MPDVVNDGFGATPPQVLNGGTVDMMCRIISTQPSQRADILTINVGSVQNAGAPVATKFIAVFVLRAPAFQRASNGLAVVPVRPTSAFGLPTTNDISGSNELLYAGYMAVTSQGVPLEFEYGELTAENGQQLAVLVAPVIDGTTTPPSYRSDPVTLTVLGVTSNLDNSNGISVATGVARSLPRYD